MTRAETARARARVLEALEAGPLSCREIAEKLRCDLLVAWAESEGVTIEDLDNPPPAARIMATVRASENGVPFVHAHDADRHLRHLEKQGLVTRIQLDGHRPMLWRLT